MSDPTAPIPTPSPMPSPPIAPHSLSEQINRSTRTLHTQLNRLILTRLPLALPPYTSNPSTYASGLLHIAPIYSTFEDLWASLLSSPQLPTTLQNTHDACDPEQPLLDSKSIPLVPNHTTTSAPLIHAPKICTRTKSLLTHLRLPGLLRAGRLIADIRSLTGTPDHQISAQLKAISHSGPLAEFLQHIEFSIEANPHVLLAYAWVLYMALFSGGRYLRAALKEAGGQGESFWSRDSSPVRPYSIDDSFIPPRSTSRPSARSAHCSVSEFNTAPTRSTPPTPKETPSPTRLPPPEPTTKVLPGLHFFSFPGASDGEDLKVLFKARIAEAEILLTSGEKDDIVKEAQHIFTYMLQLVNQLDAVLGTDLEIGTDARGRPLSASRDSVSVAKERLSRREAEESENDDAEKPEQPEGESAREGSFLNIVSGPLASFILSKGHIPALNQAIRRFSRSGTPQVTFVDEAAVEEKEGGECRGQCAGQNTSETGAVEQGRRGVLGGRATTPVMAVLLLVSFYLLYQLKETCLASPQAGK